MASYTGKKALIIFPPRFLMKVFKITYSTSMYNLRILTQRVPFVLPDGLGDVVGQILGYCG